MSPTSAVRSTPSGKAGKPLAKKAVVTGVEELVEESGFGQMGKSTGREIGMA